MLFRSLKLLSTSHAEQHEWHSRRSTSSASRSRGSFCRFTSGAAPPTSSPSTQAVRPLSLIPVTILTPRFRMGLRSRPLLVRPGLPPPRPRLPPRRAILPPSLILPLTRPHRRRILGLPPHPSSLGRRRRSTGGGLPHLPRADRTGRQGGQGAWDGGEGEVGVHVSAVSSCRAYEVLGELVGD